MAQRRLGGAPGGTRGAPGTAAGRDTTRIHPGRARVTLGLLLAKKSNFLHDRAILPGFPFYKKNQKLVRLQPCGGRLDSRGPNSPGALTGREMPVIIPWHPQNYDRHPAGAPEFRPPPPGGVPPGSTRAAPGYLRLVIGGKVEFSSRKGDFARVPLL